MKTEHIAFGKNLLEGSFLHIGGSKACLVLIVGENAHAKTLQTLCKGGAHVSKADDANGGPFKFPALVRGPVPRTPNDFSVCPTNFMGQREQHPQSMLSHGAAISLWGGIQGDSVALGSLLINILDTRTQSANPLKGRGLGEQSFRDADAASKEDSFGRGQIGSEFCFGDVVGSNQGVSCCLESRLQPCIGRIQGKDRLHSKAFAMAK